MTELNTGRYTLRGASLGGMYTSIYVNELDALFDVGVPVRAACGTRNLFLSHAHLDHLGALPGFLAMRGMIGAQTPLRIFMPAGLEAEIQKGLDAFGAMHRWPLEIEPIPMKPGDSYTLRNDLTVKAFRTWHPVPSLGYLFTRPVKKLRDEFKDLPGAEIGKMRRAGQDIFDHTEHLELAYATDTLPKVLDTTPELHDVNTLILECTFLDARKPVAKARAGCHIHMDELVPYLKRLRNETLVLMHFSQLYSPNEVRRLVAERTPAGIKPIIRPFVPGFDEGWWI